MKQILQNLKNGEIDLAELPVPQAKAGHVLIRTTRSLISLGTERMLLDFGKAGWVDKARQQPDRVKQVMQKIRTDGLVSTVQTVMSKLDQPLALGYSNAGVVVEVGRGVHAFRPGDRVASNGNHAEVVCIPEHLCARIPDPVDDTTASFTVVSAIALQGVRLAAPTLGERFAVLGLGLIGLLTVQLLRANGCRVIGFDFDPAKVALAKTFGAEAFDLSAGIDPVAVALEFSEGDGVDGVIITAATRSNEPIQQSPQMCRKRGRVVLVGVIGLELSRDDFFKKEIRFQVSCSYGPGRYEPAYEKQGLDYPIGFVRWTENRNFTAVLDLMADRRLAVDTLVSRRIPIGEAKAAYELVGSKAENLLGIVLEYPPQVDLSLRQVRLPEAGKRAAVSGQPVLGFIGAGNYAGGVLIPAFAETGARLKTIASAGGVTGTHLGKKHGFEISTTDVAGLLADPEIHAVVITTQHQSHARFVLDALAAGKHVFVEKPLCLTAAELDEITTAVRRREGATPPVVMVGFNRRFAPLIQTAAMMLAGLTGPKSLLMTVNSGFIPGSHWTQDEESGGGRIVGEGCHFLDLLRFLVGHPISGVQATALRAGQNPEQPPDTVTITLTFADGSLGTVHYFANGHKDFPKERLEVFAGGRVLQLDNFIALHGFGWPKFTRESLWAQDKGQKACARAFVDALRSGGPSPIPFAEIAEVAGQTIAAAQACETGSPPARSAS